MDRFWQAVVLGALFLVLSGTGAARTNYDVAVDADDDSAHITATIELTANPEVNYWDVSWTPPENTEILTLNDTIGEIDEFRRENGKLRFETNRHDSQQNVEVVTITARLDDAVAERYGELSLVKLRLSGYSGTDTDVTVQTEQNLLSESHSFGYDHALGPHQANFTGTGAVNLHIAVSDAGASYEHFRLFGEGNLSAAEDAYYLVPALTGTMRRVNEWPVVVLSDEQYDAQIDPWSAGQYRTGGLIFLRKKAMNADDGTAVVLHEVMHGFNEIPMKWARNGGEWFDEGMAKYIEYLYRHRLYQDRDEQQAELFGEEVTWTAPCDEGHGECRYTLPPRGDADALWAYYENDGTFMHSWSPHTAESQQQRTFGYAYGELVIRDLIRREGQDALHEIYHEMRDLDDQQTDPSAVTDQILSVSEIDFTPCYPNGRDSFDDCLADINDREPQVPDSLTIDDTAHSIAIDPIERPERQDSSTIDRITEDVQNRFDQKDRDESRFQQDNDSGQDNLLGRLLRDIGAALVALTNIFK